jgi:MFS family permease
MAGNAQGRTRLVPAGRSAIAGFLAGNFVSDIGNAFSFLAIPWFVLATGGNASQTGLVVAAGTLPYIIVGLFGGAIVDRVGLRRAAIVSDVMSGVSVAAIPLLHATVGIAYWQLIVLVVLGSLLDGPGRTARQAIYPDIVQRTDIGAERANTWFSLTGRVAQVLGTPLAGLGIAAAGPSALLWSNAASFAIAALLTLRYVPDIALHIVDPTGNDDGGESKAGIRRYLDDLRTGFRFLTGNRLLIWLASSLAMGSFLAEPIYGVILPVYANDVLGSAAQLGFIFGALGAGSIVGNLAYLVVIDRFSRGALLIGGFTVRALCFAVFLTTPSWWQIALAIFIGAVALEPSNPVLMSVRQEQVPAGMRGRVFGAMQAIAATAYPAGVVMYGWLLSALGVERTLILFVALNALLPIVMAVQPILRNLPASSVTRTP